MDNTLIDRETLGQFIDELIKQQPLPVNTAEELNDLREKSITALDDKIGTAVFSRLSKEQNAELSQMFDRDEEPSEDEYKDFFIRCGIDLEQTVTKAMQDYKTEFLGGQNA